MYIWFSLVAFPMILVGGMLATDFASAALARDEATALADAAATAGAWEINTSTGAINCGFAANQAQAVTTDFITRNADGTRPVLKSAELVGLPTVGCTPTSVTATINYVVPSSAFYDTLRAAVGMVEEDHSSSVSRTAILCIPGQAPTVINSCTRPDYDY